MTFKLKTLVALAALGAAAGSAHAVLTPASSGDGSLMFVAVDSAGSPISLQVDLGFVMSDFVPATSSFDNAGTSISWNFANNTRTVNGVGSAGNFQWSGAFSTFQSAAQAGDVRWGVLAGDSVTGGSIPGRGFLTSGSPTQAQITNYNSGQSVTNAGGTFNNSTAFANNLGTHTTAGAFGANTATSGTPYLLNTQNFGTTINNAITWTYLTANGVNSPFQYIQQVAPNPDVYQIGVTTIKDTLSPDAGLFNFDVNTATLTWTVAAPIPEPSTYAMLLAGMGLIGAKVRRRRGR